MSKLFTMYQSLKSENSLNKYLKLLNYLPYSIKIIDSSYMTKYNISEYNLEQNSIDIL